MWTCCRAPESASRSRASERRAIAICSGKSAGLSNLRANIWLAPSMMLHAAPNAGALRIASTCRAQILSLRAQSRSTASSPTLCIRRNRPRQWARANAVRNGSRASSQKASGSLLRMRRVSATPPGANLCWDFGPTKLNRNRRDRRAQILRLFISGAIHQTMASAA